MQSDNKRIAKNAIMLTLRSIFVAIVGLYTSRIVLEILGITDYGIYGVIGGIIGLVSFLNVSMAGASSRFITFEIGSGNEKKLKNIFSTSFRIHFFIAIFVVILGETVGLWFLNTKMNIPADKMFAANILYQFTVFSVLVSFTQIPYSAAILAHERMSIYAYMEIIFVVLKLAIVYVLLITSDNRLILYGFLTFLVSILNALFYRWYCTRHFKETRTLKIYDKEEAKKMFAFSGYDLYGNMCVAAQRQGQPIILNLFYGVVANAGATIAMTVMSTISSLTFNVHQAFRPQIIKRYAAGDINIMKSLMTRSLQFTLLAYSAIIIPCVICTPQLLYVWLGQIPPYSVIFLRLVLIAQVFNIGILVNNAGIHATGNIKGISFISGSIYLICPVLSYIWLKLGGAAQTIYYVYICITSLVLIVGWILLGIQIAPSIGWSQGLNTIKCILILSLVTVLCWWINNKIFLENDHSTFKYLLELIITTAYSVPLLFLTYIFVVLSKKDRSILTNKIKSAIHKKFMKLSL